MKLNIPDLTLSFSITDVEVVGGSVGVLDEFPEKFDFAYTATVGKNGSLARMTITGEVSVATTELEAQNAGKPLAQMSQRALVRNTLGLLRPKIKVQIQELFRKEPIP